jgi:hypothetical protein
MIVNNLPNLTKQLIWILGPVAVKSAMQAAMFFLPRKVTKLWWRTAWGSLSASTNILAYKLLPTFLIFYAVIQLWLFSNWDIVYRHE